MTDTDVLLIGIYEDLIQDLRKMGWNAKCACTRSFPHIAINELSIFIDDDKLRAIGGCRLPPTIETLDLNNPNVDPIKWLNKILHKNDHTYSIGFTNQTS